MRKWAILLPVLCVILTSMGGCQDKEVADTKQNATPGAQVKEKKRVVRAEMEEDDKLVVYVSGTKYGFLGGEEQFVQYPSRATVGMRGIAGEIGCYQGNAIAQAVLDYSEETGIPVEIHFLEENADGDNVLRKLAEKNQMPDLLIVGKHNGYDYSVLAEQGILYNWNALTAQDETWNDEKYYSKVLKGGMVGEEQFILPLLFNMNAFISSEAYMKELNVSAEEKSSFEEILYVLEQSCIASKEDENREAIFEASGNMVAGKYIPSILLSAAYPSYWNDEMGEFLAEEQVLRRIFKVMELFNQQEFVGINNWEEKTYSENVSAKNKWATLKILESFSYEQVGIFLSGGRCGGLNLHNSMLTDAAYFQTAYEKKGEKMVFGGMPIVEEEGAYAANITLAAMSFAETKYPEIVYDLSKYLMDYSFPMYYGFSVNREKTEAQLQDVQTTQMAIYPEAVWSAVTAGDLKQENIEKNSEIIGPLDKEYVEKIQKMLENIAGAGIPCNTVEYTLFSRALDMLGEKRMGAEDCARWMVEKTKLFDQKREELPVFLEGDYGKILDKAS